MRSRCISRSRAEKGGRGRGGGRSVVVQFASRYQVHVERSESGSASARRYGRRACGNRGCEEESSHDSNPLRSHRRSSCRIQRPAPLHDWHQSSPGQQDSGTKERKANAL